MAGLKSVYAAERGWQSNRTAACRGLIKLRQHYKDRRAYHRLPALWDKDHWPQHRHYHPKIHPYSSPSGEDSVGYQCWDYCSWCRVCSPRQFLGFTSFNHTHPISCIFVFPITIPPASSHFSTHHEVFSAVFAKCSLLPSVLS